MVIQQICNRNGTITLELYHDKSKVISCIPWWRTQLVLSTMKALLWIRDVIQIKQWSAFIMTSSNGNNFRVPDSLWGETTVVRVGLFAQRLNKRLIKKKRNAGRLRRHHAQYDVTVMLQRIVKAAVMVVAFKQDMLVENLSIYSAHISQISHNSWRYPWLYP